MSRRGADAPAGGRADDGTPTGWSAPPDIDIDIIETGPPGSGAPAWRGRAAVGILVALIIAGLLGYLIGRAHPGAGTPTGQPSPARPVANGAPTFAGPPATDPTLAQTPNRCSVQSGHRLQLGVELANRSTTAATLRGVRVTLPLGGLRMTASAWGTCGDLSALESTEPYLVNPGTTAWVTVTFDVLVPCPAPLPVQLAVDDTRAGRADVVYLGGFPDLGDVPYTGCGPSPF